MKQKDETVDEQTSVEEIFSALAKKLGISISEIKSGGKDNMSKELEVLQAKITEQEEAITAKDTEIGTLSQQVTDAKEATEALEAKVAELQATIDKDTNEDESEEVTALKSDLETVRAELVAEKEAKETLDTELAEIKAEASANEKWEAIKEKYDESSKDAVITALKKSEKNIPLSAEDIGALTSTKVKHLVQGQTLPAGGELSDEAKAKMRRDYGIKGGKV